MRNLAAIVVLAVCVIASVGCQSAPPSTAADEAAIRKSAPAWAAAFNAGDANTMADMYWDDAVLQPPGAPSATGRAAIREFLAAEIAGAGDAGLTMNIPEAGAVDVSGDLAYEAGSYTVTDASGAVIDSGKYIGVFLKRDETWRYIRDTWNSDLPPPAVAEVDAAVIED